MSPSLRVGVCTLFLLTWRRTTPTKDLIEIELSLPLSLREAVNLGDAASHSASSVIGKVLSGGGRDCGMEGSGRRETATRDVGVWLSLHITVDDVRASVHPPRSLLHPSVRPSVVRSLSLSLAAPSSPDNECLLPSFPPSLSLLVVISHACISMPRLAGAGGRAGISAGICQNGCAYRESLIALPGCVRGS